MPKLGDIFGQIIPSALVQAMGTAEQQRATAEKAATEAEAKRRWEAEYGLRRSEVETRLAELIRQQRDREEQKKAFGGAADFLERPTPIEIQQAMKTPAAAPGTPDYGVGEEALAYPPERIRVMMPASPEKRAAAGLVRAGAAIPESLMRLLPPTVQAPSGYPPIGGLGVSPAVSGGPGPSAPTIDGVWAPTIHPETGRTEFRFHPFTPAELQNKEVAKQDKALSDKITREFATGKPNYQGIIQAAGGVPTAYGQNMVKWAQGELDKTIPTKPSEERESTADKLFGMPWSKLAQEQKLRVDADIQQRKTDPGIERMLALTRGRPVRVIDTTRNNESTWKSFGEVEDANTKTPGRFLDSTSPEGQLRVKAQFYGLAEVQRGNRIFDTVQGRDVTTAVGTSRTAFDPDTMVSIPKEKSADMQLALARRNSYVTLSKDIEGELGRADDAVRRGEISATEWAKRITGSSVLWKKIAALNDHALTSMRVLTGGAPRSEMMLEVSQNAFGNISPGTSKEVISQARTNFLVQMDEQIKGYQYGLQTPGGTGPGGPTGGPTPSGIQDLRKKYGY